MTKFEHLASIDPNDLIRLAGLIESGLLASPASELALRDHVADAQVTPVTRCLNDLAQQDLPPHHVALLLRAVAAGRSASGKDAVSVEVVTSGPDTSRGARDTAVVLRQMFGNARERVMIAGFAVHQGKTVFKALADHLDHDKTIDATLCIDIRRERSDTSLDRDILRRFANQFVRDQWPGKRLPRVYFDPRSLASGTREVSSMHAKCVVVDGRKALVTSANFTEAAHDRNIELGLLVDSQRTACRIEEHFLSLIRNGHLKRLTLP